MCAFTQHRLAYRVPRRAWHVGRRWHRGRPRVIRDCFEGSAATKLLALVTMIFSLSPALAPVFGGWVVTLFTWRAIFLTLFVYAVAMVMLCALGLPETLPAHARHPIGIGSMALEYVAVFGNRRFCLIALAIAFSFAGLFLYVASVAAFIGHELGLPPTDYAVMFVPIVPGIVLGSFAAARLAGRVASTRLILAGFSIELVTGIVNVAFHAAHAATVPWSVLPLAFYAFGHSLATPGLTLAGLDQFPQIRGMAASCQAFAMLLLAGLVSQLAPTFGGHALALGLENPRYLKEIAGAPEEIRTPDLQICSCGSRAHTKLPNRQSERGDGRARDRRQRFRPSDFYSPARRSWRLHRKAFWSIPLAI
jgi:hypothetical protein